MATIYTETSLPYDELTQCKHTMTFIISKYTDL